MALHREDGILQEMEDLRDELYVSADAHHYLLTSKEIYQASTNLDKIIVKYLKKLYSDNLQY